MKKWVFLILSILILIGCKNKPEQNSVESGDAEQTEVSAEDSVKAGHSFSQLNTVKSNECLTVFGVLLAGDSEEKVLRKLTDGVSEIKHVGKDWTKISFCGVTFDMSINWNNIHGKKTVDDLILMSMTMDVEAFNRIKNYISVHYDTPMVNEIKDTKELFSGHCEWRKECHTTLQSVKMGGKDAMLLIFSND